VTLGVFLSAAAGHDEQGRILLALAFVLVGAKLFGAVVERLGQPAVLGELLFGVLLGEQPLHETLRSITALLVPVFFVRMGMLVHVDNFLKPGVMGFAVLLTLAAMIGKWACGLAVPRGVSRVTVGLGMMPRGEVGLIFAGIGASLMVQGHPVVSAQTYAAAVFMVVVTTMATPPLLLWSLRRDV